METLNSAHRISKLDLIPINRNFITVKPVLSDHINQVMFLAFYAGGCLLGYESSAFCTTFIQQ